MQDGNLVLLPSKATHKLYDGTLRKQTGEWNLKADHDGEMFHVKFQVMETSQIPLLSNDMCERLRLLHVNHSHVLHHVDTPSTTSTEVIMTNEEIISKSYDVFDRLGCLP